MHFNTDRKQSLEEVNGPDIKSVVFHRLGYNPKIPLYFAYELETKKNSL